MESNQLWDLADSPSSFITKNQLESQHPDSFQFLKKALDVTDKLPFQGKLPGDFSVWMVNRESIGYIRHTPCGGMSLFWPLNTSPESMLAVAKTHQCSAQSVTTAH